MKKVNTLSLVSLIMISLLLLLSACSKSAVLDDLDKDLALSTEVSKTTNKTLDFKNTGSQLLSFTSTSSNDWLVITPEKGDVAIGASQELDITATCDADVEKRSATVTLNYNGGKSNIALSLDCTRATTGSLVLTVDLPEGTAAPITVTGPNDFSQSVISSTTLNDLVEGTYTITSEVTQIDIATYAPEKLVQTVTITGGETTDEHIGFACTQVKPNDVGLDNLLKAVTKKDSYNCFDLEQITTLSDHMVFGESAPPNLDKSNYIPIKDLKALQYVKNLEWLYLGGSTFNYKNYDNYLNQVSEIPSTLELKKLKHLDLSNNPIAKIPTSFNLDNLEYLGFHIHNSLESNLDLSSSKFKGLTNLKTLDLSGNQITNLPKDIFSELENLTTLNLEGNALLSSLDSKIFEKLTKLEKLDLKYTNYLGPKEIKQKDLFSSLNQLTTLSLRGAGLTSLDIRLFSNLNNLKELDLVNNCLNFLENPTRDTIATLRTQGVNLILDVGNTEHCGLW